MALALDASTPALVAQTSITTTVTTASFTPPAGSLLMAAPFCSQNAATMSFTMSDSLSLTWNTIVLRNSTGTGTVQSAAGLYWAAATGAAMTVTATVVNSFLPTLKVYVFTGADMSSPVGTPVNQSSTSTSFSTSNLTTTRLNSYGVMCVAGSTANAVTSNNSTYEAGPASNGHYGLAAYKAFTTVGPYSFHIETSGTPKMNIVFVELKAALSAPRNGDFLPFFAPGHNDDELATRRATRRTSGLYVPRARELCRAA